MSFAPAISAQTPALVRAAAVLDLRPAATIAPSLQSVSCGALVFGPGVGAQNVAAPTLTVSRLAFGAIAPVQVTPPMLVAIKGDPGPTGSMASLSQDAGQLARLGSDDGIYVSQDDVRALAAAQDTALITDFDALVAATLGV